LMRQLCDDSFKKRDTLLKLDKKWGRKELAKVAPHYRDFVVERIALGGLYLSEIWRRQLGWTLNGERFYYFNPAPQHIKAAEEPPTPL
jgi:hypothetical protein